MSTHVHTFRTTSLTAEEAALIKHPYLTEGHRVFICVLPECGMIMTGNPMSDRKNLKRKLAI